jgi:predicted amidohydrolase
MKIAICQYDIKWEDKAANKGKIAALLDAYPRKKEIDWLIFSEMTLSGFTMNTSVSELDDSDRQFFCDLAQKNNINISYGGVENGFNNLITVNRHGDRIKAYSKIHLYAFGQEDKYYKAGSKQEIFELEGMKIVPLLCFDLKFPYLFWNMAEKTDIYVVIAAWPMRRAEHWMTLLKARTIENQCYCIGVNRLGFEGKIEYSGNSMCFDPLGKVVLDCQSNEGVFVSEIDVTKELVCKTRERFPFLKERKNIEYRM